MLTFEQKLEIITSFPELERSDVSLGRVNFQYADSVYDRKNVVYHLHPNGNGFVYAALLEGYDIDDKGLVNIRSLDEPALRTLIAEAIKSLSFKPEVPLTRAQRRRQRANSDQQWVNEDSQTLQVRFEEDTWMIYEGINLEMAFETYEEAVEYLEEEGFSRE